MCVAVFRRVGAWVIGCVAVRVSRSVRATNHTNNVTVWCVCGHVCLRERKHGCMCAFETVSMHHEWRVVRSMHHEWCVVCEGMYASVCVSVCMYVCMYEWVHICICVCLYVCVDVCVCLSVYVCICVYACQYVCVYVMYACMHV